MRTSVSVVVLLVAGACGEVEDGEPSQDASAAADTVPENMAAEDMAVSVPADWVRVEVHCGFSFMAPPDVMAEAAVGLDSCIDEWVGSGCMYGADYGGYSNDLSEYAGQDQFTVTRATIDGRSARLVSGRTPEQGLIAAVHFPQVDGGGSVKLTVSARCDDAAAQQNALLSYRTITFEP